MESNQDDREYFDFLINLRDSGVTNMFGAAPYLSDEFDLDKHEARQVLGRWMESFDKAS
tara:strand:+ start:1382 stop:1558 length:177 start_codon:yes stop_codon:yes gene_type:complete